ncbi:MAG: radical SAM protein [Anaerolineaceae bacterium]
MMDIHIIPIDEGDHFIIYRPLLGLAFIGNLAMADYCKKGPTSKGNGNDEMMRFLSDIGFFMPETEPPSPEKTISCAVLLLTNQCQLRCSYCYAAAGESEPQNLCLESGYAAIDYVFSQAKENNLESFRVDFHGGGEPSLEWQGLKNLTEFARKKTIPASISLTSNAIWSRQQCAWIIKNIDRLSISMDGTPETQDMQRPFQNKSSSSPFVMRNLQALDEAGYSYGIRMTACQPWTNLSKDIRFVFENTQCRSIQVEPAFNVERGKHIQPNTNQYQDFARAFKQAYDDIQERDCKLTYSGARPGIRTRIFCSAPYNALIINPENDIVSCYEITNSRHPLSKMSTLGRIQNQTIVFDDDIRTLFYQKLKNRFDEDLQ